jgi:hypothetical protein
MKIVVVALALGFVWGACSAPLRLMRAFTGTSTPTPSLTPQLTPSPVPSPSATLQPNPSPRPSPTLDPSITLSPTPTYVLPTQSPTATALSALDCRLDWQSPGSGIEFDRSEEFTVGWKLTNTGNATWSPESVQFMYLGGAQMHRDPVIQLEFSVPPGESVVVTADMKAPRNSTLYTTYWGLREGDAFFCRVSLTIYAK